MNPMQFPKTRMVWLGPVTFFFHRDLSGEVALTPDDEPVLCQACSDDQVRAGVMERLGDAPNSEQCRCCGRFSWGRVESVAEFTRSLGLDGEHPAGALEVLAELEDETAQRLADLGEPPTDPVDAERTRERLSVVRCLKTFVASLQQASHEREGQGLLAELAAIVHEVARGYGEMDAPNAPYADILRRADAYLGAAAGITGARP
ncbi:MAG: hypothetical protein HGA45_39670 [Chloroflexales bacterium]|nr:hypothetical protein [Chloroflexales bacterium]